MNQTEERMSSKGSENNYYHTTDKLKVHVWLFAAICVGLLLVIGLGTRYYLKQDFSVIHAILSAFFSVNIVVCWWEACLFWQRNQMEDRAAYWRDWRDETGNLPHVKFFTSKIPLKKVFASKIWAEIWATYALYDYSYADRRTYGFNIDIANGFFTLLPTVFLYLAITVYFLPAYVVGMIGLMLCWQWIYITSLYWVSFFVAQRHHKLSKREICLYIFGASAPWFLCPLLGLFVCIRLIVDGNYSVLG